MPLYEYRCATCDDTFERLRPMSRVDERTSCPQGHDGAERVVSLVAAGTWNERATFEMPAVSGGGCGGCAGGACACSG